MTDIELITQNVHTLRMKLSLLDEAYQTVEELEGAVISLSPTISSNSDIRRTLSATLVMDDGNAGNVLVKKMWLDKMVEALFGMLDDSTGEVRWFSLGRYLFSNNSYSYDASTRQVQLSLVDMMAAAMEDRGSQIGTAIEIPSGSSIKSAFEAAVARFTPYKRTNVCEFDDTVPYDIETNRGSYAIDTLRSLLNIFPYYEMFYDKTGTFVVRKIPMQTDEACVISADVMSQIVISESGGTDFSDIKNATEIWGRSIDAGYTAASCAHTGNQYTLVFGSTFEALEDSMTYSFTPDVDCEAGQTIKVQDLDAVALYTQSEDVYTAITAGAMLKDRPYVVKYSVLSANDENDPSAVVKRFVLQGPSEIHAMCMEYNVQPSASVISGLKTTYDCEDIGIVVNPDSPFAIDYHADNGARGNGIILQVLSDGEYDNITTTDLALQRASYENWKKTRLKDVVHISSLFVPWLDVNQKIEYTSIMTGETHQYIVQEISANTNEFTMDLTLQRFYSYYPWLT